MKFKLTALVSNGSGTSRELSDVELSGLTNGVLQTAVSVVAGDSLEIVCDLYNRYVLDRIDYFYEGDGSVSIYYAESEGLWGSVNYSTVTSGISAPLSGISPRWLRIDHDLVSGSATSYEVEIYNNDNNILFGDFGLKDKYSIDRSGEVVQAIPIFNSTSEQKDIKVFIEDDISTNSDDLVSIGSSSSGPFYGKRERGVHLPRDFSWLNGDLINVTTSGSYLCLLSPNTSGTYYSPVFDTSAYADLRFFWTELDPENGLIDFITSENDSERSFGLRQHHQAPTGSWFNGQLSDPGDPVWNINTGSLIFNATPNNTILELRDRKFMQFCVTITGSYSNSPCVIAAGVESATVVSGVSPFSSKALYASVVSGTSGQTANLTCWFEG